MEYQHSETTKQVIAAAMAVHGELGNGFQEVIYQRALAWEMESRKMVFGREVEMPVYYQGMEVGMRRVDFVVDGKVSVELKALVKLDDVHLAQGKNYLEAFNLEVGLLVNFGAKSLEVKRLYNAKYDPKRLNVRLN
jgi:GxxExxY protein